MSEYWRPISRVSVERVAHIMGRQSASAKALAEADAHDGKCRFYQVVDRSGSTHIVVERSQRVTA